MFSYAPVNNFSQQKNDSNQSSIPRYSSPPVKSSASQYNDKQEEYRAMYKHPITRFFFGPGRLFVVKPWKDKGWFVVQLILRADGDFAWRIIGICYPFYDFKSTQPVDIVPLKNNEWFYRDDFFLPGAIFNKSLEINQYICSLVPRKTNAKPTFSKSGWKFFSSICTSTVKYGKLHPTEIYTRLLYN